MTKKTWKLDSAVPRSRCCGFDLQVRRIGDLMQTRCPACGRVSQRMALCSEELPNDDRYRWADVR